MNAYGHGLVRMCQMCGLLFMNERAGADKGLGHMTFCGSKGENAIDYVLSCIESTYQYIYTLNK